MAGGGSRWQGAPSEYAWERDALAHIRGLMPDAEPYRAWHNVSFVADNGHVREVDLVIAVPAGLFVVEIKSHPGRVTNNGTTWTFHAERARTIDNPIFLANQKAKELRSLLGRAAGKGGKVHIPFIDAAIFLAATDLVCELDEFQREKVYGRDGVASGLPGIWHDLLGAPPGNEHHRLGVDVSRALPGLLHKAGVQGARPKPHKVGQWKLPSAPMEAGPTWVDFLGENEGLAGDVRRVRIFLSARDASTERKKSIARAARREYLALQGIEHPGIVRAEQFTEEHEAGPAVVFGHGRGWRRLDHYMAERGGRLDDGERLDMVRQVAEAVDHAHRRHLYHRALAARSVWVQPDRDGRHPRLRIADWQVAARTGSGAPGADAGRRAPSALPDSLMGSPLPGLVAAHVEAEAAPYLAPQTARPDADAVPLDVFGLGTIAFLVLTGTPPAADREALLRQLGESQGLIPSVTGSAITPEMDNLVYRATQLEVYDRTPSVRDFLHDLDEVEEKLTAPTPPIDLLEAKSGDTVGDWWIEAVLGKGSTARAFLVVPADQVTPGTRPGTDVKRYVLKAALDLAAADRLVAEAEVLAGLRDRRVVRLYGAPQEIGGRLALVLDRAGERNLAEELRNFGRLSLSDLERFSGELFRAVEALASSNVRHRDLKPDNVGIETQPNDSRILVLFDFSLASAPETAVGAGTPPYLDPFLGTERRTRYDDAAEWYAVAVTLHEMASGELPTWGDGQTPANLLPPAESVPQLAEDLFEPGLREGLVRFFHTALHRDVTRRFASLTEMEAAWREVFAALGDDRPLSTPLSGDDQSETADEAREHAAALVTFGTSLGSSGLSPRAQAAARDSLQAYNVRDLIDLRADEIRRVPGVEPRNELLRRAAQWRRRLRVAEEPAPADDGEAPEPEGGERGLDGLVRRLVPQLNSRNAAQVEATRLLLALPAPDGTPSPVPPWATGRDVIAAMPDALPGSNDDGKDDGKDDIGALLRTSRERWHKSSPPAPQVRALRTEVADILDQLGRVAEAREVAARLLAHHASRLSDQDGRMRQAMAALRAAVETEERLGGARFVSRRVDGPAPHGRIGGVRVILALVGGEGRGELDKEDAFAYAQLLGGEADELVGGEQLPATTTALRRLREVPLPPGLPPLADTRLIALAAAVAGRAAVNGQSELYPRDLAATKALKLAQAGLYLMPRPGRSGESAGGAGWKVLRAGVLARFPGIELPDTKDGLRAALREAGFRAEYDGEDRLVVPPPETATSLSATSRPEVGTRLRTPEQEQRERLAAALHRGGPLAVTVWSEEYPRHLDEFAAAPAVVPVNVGAAFVATLRSVVAEQGRPPWDAVVAADSPDAPVNARAGFARLQAEVWRRLEDRIRAAAPLDTDPRVVLLHDATPLARYESGQAFLARLLDAARRPDQAPHGLWLLCPMPDPERPASIDEHPIGLDSDQTRVTLRRTFTLMLHQIMGRQTPDDGLTIADQTNPGRAS